MELKRVVKKIRGHLAALGWDVSSLTDEEIERGTLQLSKAVGKFGVSTKDVLQALGSLRSKS
jgi:hypothetical protein